MNVFLTILSHTYRDVVKRRSFIILTIIYLVALSLIVAKPKITNLFISKPGNVVIINQSYIPLSSKDFDKHVGLGYRWSDGSKSELNQLKDNLLHRSGQLDAVIVINNTSDGRIGVQFINMDKASDLISSVQSFVQSKYTYTKMNQLGVNSTVFSDITAPVKVNHESLNAPVKQQSPAVAYIASMLLYMFILSYGMMIAQSVAIEKSTRVQEILIASVKPKFLFLGKLSGITLAGLTQLFIVLIGMLGLTYYMYPTGSLLNILKVTPAAVVIIIISFFLGYLFYALLMAGVGSLVSRTEDLQPLLVPIMYMSIAAYLVSLFAPKNPNATWIIICSFIPGLSQQVMVVRYMLTNVPIWQLVFSYGILLTSVIIIGWFVIKVYRIGVTMYGQRPKFKQIFAITKNM